MKKRLNTEELENELAGSVFFPKRQNIPLGDTPLVAQTPSATPPKVQEQKPRSPLSQPSQKKATLIPRYRDTTMPEQDNTLEEAIRKAVKQVGKEAATYRFIKAEKEALADIEYSYKRQGIRTSGNEIIRIGLNFLVEDYHRNGKNSILAKILKLLNA